MGVQKLQDKDSRILLPEEERYSIKHPPIYFQDYKTAITEYDFFQEEILIFPILSIKLMMMLTIGFQWMIQMVSSSMRM